MDRSPRCWGGMEGYMLQSGLQDCCGIKHSNGTSPTLLCALSPFSLLCNKPNPGAEELGLEGFPHHPLSHPIGFNTSFLFLLLYFALPSSKFPFPLLVGTMPCVIPV